MASRIDIVVAARDQASRNLQNVNNSISTMSARFNDARARAAELARQERIVAENAEQLRRRIALLGQDAPRELYEALSDSDRVMTELAYQAQDVQHEISQINREMGQANRQAWQMVLAFRAADAEAARVHREFNRWDRVLRRNIGDRIDRIGHSIANLASNAVSSGIDAVSSGLQLMAKHAVTTAAAGPAIAGLAVVVAGVIADLSGIIATLPAAALAGAASLAVFKLGLKGVSEAFEAGLSGDAEKFKESLKGLNEHAQEFVKTGVKIVEAWKPLQRVVQGHLFRGAAENLKAINSVVQPLAEKWLPKIANLFAQAGGAVAGFFKSAGVSSQLDTIMQGVWRNIDGVLKSVPFLLQAFTDIGEAGSFWFGDLGQGIGGLAERFANWIREMKESGELQRWVDRAKESFDTLGRIAEDVGRVIKSVFKNGADEGQTFLENIEKQTEKWAEFMESADGQKLVDSLGTIGAAMGNLVGLIQFLSEVWLGWVAVFEDGIAFINRGWDSMMEMALNAFGAIIDALVALFGKLPIIGDLLKQAQSDFNAFRNGATNSMNQVSNSTLNAANSVNSLSGAINSLQSKTVYVNVIQRVTKSAELSGDYSSGIGGRASGGIATGMKWVGERGPELVDFGAYSASVKSAGASRELARQGNNSSTTVQLVVSAGSVTGNPLVDLFLEALRRGWIVLRADPNSGRVSVA